MVIQSNVRATRKREQPLLFPSVIEEETRRMKQNRALIFLSLFLIAMMSNACSLNRQLPKEADEEAMVVEVRAAIAAAVPGKTFDLGVDVTEGGNVTLTGQVDSSSDRDAIVAKVRQVNGVKSVNASGLHVKM
jgi:predicted thioesterase